ncbi:MULTISPECIES: glucan biosynthesis protein [Inquilinus]|uniref:Glucans biosynthesis protein n=1 Tax=Inquilinus ginsengisoli TaxID=363840 RepID=A0ABU1JT17_9PROT|nr:glucan biosynthesis protein D [Inquilinus ginsengisoli]MDR6291763.1 glucans biosynthesis protein [Inquilinus ginsengisoli]
MIATPLHRRTLFRAAGAAALLAGLPAAQRAAAAEEQGLALGAATPFSYDLLTARAQALAAQPYQPPYRPAPEIVEAIDYDAHGKIKFKTDLAPYADGTGAYPATFFHLGRFFGEAVRMNLVVGDDSREILYRPRYFDMPEDSPARKLPADSGFAGFRLQESNKRDDWRTQDWVAFLGASYFRAIGALGQYGMSARGIAIDVAVKGSPEEFPIFTQFFIAEAPDPAQPVVVCALLDGPSVSGAYRFTLHRTEGVVMEVEAAVFLRKAVTRLGLAPLTSMFWYGEYGRGRMLDWRPEVHDSDGLAIWTAGGERIWRPLNNPREIMVSSFGGDSPRGFGLMQRDRNFDHYLDGVFYDRRPSVWVEPLAPLGRGAIQLVELPTDDEIHDNIVAFWVPEDRPAAGSRLDLSYRLHWLADEPYPDQAVARTIATRMGRGGEPGKPRPPGVYKIVAEFDNPAVMRQIPYGVFPDVVVTASRGTIVRPFSEPVPNGNVWRATFDLAVDGTDPVELRLFLRLNDKPLTETWLYQFHPEPPPA